MKELVHHRAVKGAEVVGVVVRELVARPLGDIAGGRAFEASELRKPIADEPCGGWDVRCDRASGAEPEHVVVVRLSDLVLKAPNELAGRHSVERLHWVTIRACDRP